MFTANIAEPELKRVKEMTTYMRTDTVRVNLMDSSNAVSLSEGYVDHGEKHAQDALRLTLHVVDNAERIFPGTFDEFFNSTAVAGILMHDVGRSVAGKDHDKHGAVITDQYLKELAVRLYGSEDALPDVFRARTVSLVRRHRADSWLYKTAEEKARRTRELDGPDIAAVLLGDKLCGSEVRVPPAKQDLLNRLARIKIPRGFRRKHKLDSKWTFARINWNTPDLIVESPEFIKACLAALRRAKFKMPTDISIGPHDRVNGAIKRNAVEMFADTKIDDGKPESANRKIKGTFVYHLDIDERLAPQELVTGLDWWHDAFHVAAKAAKYLGFRFQIVFNGRHLIFDRAVNNWVFVDIVEYKIPKQAVA
ncbi:MAG: hypothetical protein P4L53_04365 [Candidatus Obscuribacterales bacterium]|nr:hypothetical protein [Candidatus Obscuribacterales bacterium]